MEVGDILRLFVIVSGVFMVVRAILSLAKRKMTEPILSFMGVFVCINDSFRCTFKSISDEALCQYTRTDSDYNNCVRCSVGIMVYQYAGFYPEKKNQELAMQISLLNNDCEKILRELEKLKREK